MAFTAREVIMTFRGQNYLSGAIRRVGRDVGSLSRLSTISNQRASAAIVAQRARNTLRVAQAEQLSIQTGSRALAIERARETLSNSEFAHSQKIRRNYEQQLGVIKKSLDTQTRIEQVVAAQAGRKANVPRSIRQLTPEQQQRALQAAYAEQERLLNSGVTLRREQERLTTALSQQSVAAQQLAARESELFEREAQLTQIINTRTAAVERAELQERRLAMVEDRILPVQKWQDRARAVEHFGRVLQMTGLIATAVLGASAQASASLSTAVTLAATQARPVGASPGATANIARNVQKQTLQLMRQLPFSGQDFADAFYQIFSGTNIQSVKQATDLVKVFGRAAVAGGTDLKTMVDVGITMHNVFPKEFKNSTDAANAFFAAVRYGRMNAQQFAASLPNIVPIAQRVGLSFKDIADAIAALTRQSGGRFTTRDAQGVARMLQIFARPDFVAGAKKMGVNIKDLHGNMRPLLDIISEFAAKEKGTGGVDALNLFKTISGKGSPSGVGGTQGTIQAQRAFAFLINDVKSYRNVSKLVRQDNNEMTRSFEAMSKAPGVRWTIFINQLKVLAYTIGTQVIPVFLQLGKPVEAIVNWFLKLSPETQHVVATLLAVSAVGSLVVGTFAGIAGGLASIITTFMLWRRMRILDTMVETSVAASRTGGALSAIINPRTGAAFTEFATGASQAAGTVGELGAATAEFAIRLGKLSILATVITSLILFHRQAGQIVNDLGGMKNIIDLASIALSAFAAIRTISGLTRLATAALEAGGTVSKLRLALLSVNGLVAVATLVLLFKSHGFDISNPLGFSQGFRDKVDSELNKAQNAVTKYTGTHAIASLFGFPGGFGRYAETRTPSQIQAEQSQNAIKQAIADSPRYQHAIRANQQQVDAFNKELDKQARLVNQVQVKQAVASIRQQPDLVSSIRSIHNLKTEAEQSPNIKTASQRWNKYYAVLAKLINGKTKIQQQAIKQLLNNIPTLPANIAKRSIQGDIDAMIKAQKAALANPSSLKAQIDLSRAEDTLNKKYKDRPDLLKAINSVIGNYIQNLDSASTSTKTLGVTFQDVLSGIQSMYQNFQQQETSLFGDIFNGPFVNNPLTQNRTQFGGRLSGQDLLHDLHSQVSQFTHFHNRLDNLRRRGAPQELLNQLMAAGDTTENMRNIAALQSLNPNQLRQYFQTFNQGQQLIKQQTMRDLNNQLKIYRQHGRNIALAIIAGLRDENVNLTNTLSRMIRKMFPGLPTGQTGAGGRPAHRPRVDLPVTPHVDVHVHPDRDKENKPPITKKAQERHAVLRQKNKFAPPRGGVPR